MKNYRWLLWLLPCLFFAVGAALVTPGRKVPDYPNTATYQASDLLLLTVTNIAVPTNKNIKMSDLSLQMTNASATTNYVNNATNSLATTNYVNSATNGLATTNYANQVSSNRVVVLSGTNVLVSQTSTNGTNFYAVNSTASGASFSGSTNFINLSGQAIKRPTTNYTKVDAGYQAWETVYYETNAEGIRTNLNGSWQFVTPPDYATNSMQLYMVYSLLATNGPNASNVIFGGSVLIARPGTTNNIRTNLFGFTAWGTNSESPFFDQTNAPRSMTISLGTNSLLMKGDVGVINVVRDAFNDTYGGAVALHGLQLIYTRP